ncbi:MAG: nucleoside hydrolase [Verrucomicrobia bacterium]|nr:nucleoside hydrolase [Verrucomicrobiota bacterium]MBV8484292.1 nucleoside hydrolase [Verrucomicrobiota bacterium]
MESNLGSNITKLHLDTDLGGDIDDLCALAMLCKWPDLDLSAVTTNQDDRGTRAGYVRYALNLAGKPEVPVAAGADPSLNCYRFFTGLPDENRYWPEPIPPAPSPLDKALDLLQNSIEEGAIIAGIGAYTNLALLEKRNPGCLEKANLCLMGGYLFPVPEGFPQWGYDMDWNMQIDAESALLVLERANPVLVPMTITLQTWLRRADLPALQQAGPVEKLISRQAESWAEDHRMESRFGQACSGLPKDTINFQHDPLACAIALGWKDGIEIEEYPVVSEIRDSWLRQRVDPAGKPTKVVTRVDGAKFTDFWLRLVAG